MAPPRKMAAQTCPCVWLAAPIHVFGEIHKAAAIPASHCATIRLEKKTIRPPMNLVL